MKKLFFISIVLMLVAGMAFAIDSTYQQPVEVSAEIIPVEYNTDSGIIIQQAVLEPISGITSEISSLQLVIAQNNTIAIKPTSINVILRTFITKHVLACNATNFYLRC